ncbi:hypothetical protein ACOSQ3_021776 [Xanthoceras sorbifolium]
MEEESTQKIDNSLNEAGLVENVEDQEDLNFKTLEETEHKSESDSKGLEKVIEVTADKIRIMFLLSSLLL